MLDPREKESCVLNILVCIPSAQSTVQHMAAAQYLMNQWTFQSLFLIYKSEVCCIGCEEHNVKEEAGIYSGHICPRLLWDPKTSRPLFSQLQVSSTWKSWRKKSLVFATFYPANPSNVSLSVSSLRLCHNLLSPGEASCSHRSHLWPSPNTTPRAMCAWRYFSSSLCGAPPNQTAVMGPVIVNFIFQQGQATVSNCMVKH